MTQGTLHIPTVETDRLVLRGPVRGDFEAYASMLADPRTLYMGGPFDRAAAWGEFSKLVASWQFDGFGGWVITAGDSGAFLGDIGVLKTSVYPEPELGWTLTDAAEGHGYAFEAAQAVLSWWWAETEARSVVSYIHVDNARSQALAKRLGAAHDPKAIYAEGDSAADTVIYRHMRPTDKERLQ